MSGRLDGKVAIVTGGASGIGAAVVRLFVQEGARVIAADLQAPQDEALVRLLDARSEAVAFIQVDVTNGSAVAASIAEATSRWGRLDVAVACAGIDGQGSLAELTEDAWDRTMAVNAKGVFLLNKHAVPHMIGAGGGSIINISSAYGITGAPGFAAYCASKGAVRTFTKAVALEHASSGVRANSIHPGVIETPMLRALFDRTGDPAGTRTLFEAQQPGGSTGTPEDVAWACVYLASDEARFVTGVELPIDGGLLAR